MPQIPAGWKETTLGEVSDITSSKRIFANEYKTSWIPFFRGKEITEKFYGNSISTELFISEERYKELEKTVWVPQEGDILLTSVWTLGNPYLVEKGMKFYFKDWNITRFHNFKDVSPKWLFYRIISPIGKEILSHAKIGSTQQAYTIISLKQLPILLPLLLPEQQAIAAVLSSFDDKIELLRAENQTLEQMGQELFKERFGKWKVGDDLPEGWRVGKIENIFHFLEWPWIRNWQYTDSWTKFINIKLIQNHDILTNGANFVSNEEAYWRYKHFLLEERDFVLSTSWTLGRGAIVRRKHLPLMLNTSVIRFRPLDKKSYWFMYLYLSSKVFIHQLESMASWSVQLNFWPMHLKQINLIIPNNSMIDQFCNITNNLFEKIINNLDQIDELSATRDLLLPKLMSGEVRVEF